MLLAICGSVSAQDEIKWLRSYDQGSALARESGKPLLIDFTAVWCGPCKVMDNSFWPRPDVVAESDKFVMVKLDFDKDVYAVQKFQASGLPHIIFADPWGNILASQRGFVDGSDNVVLSKMKVIPADFTKVREGLAKLAADREDEATLDGLAVFYREIRSYDLSSMYYRRRLDVAEKKANSEAIESALLNIATNTFKSQDLIGAQKIYEDMIRRFPDGNLTERAYAGLVTCQAFRKKLPDAEKTFNAFKSRFPNSKLLSDARMAIDQIKRLPPAK
jgi:tetratricopeptide (TPR) repeat protein